MRSIAVWLTLCATPLALAAQVQRVLGCADTKYPAEFPPPSALVDSAHAIADLAPFADPATPMVFSVFFAMGDSVAQVRALESQDAAAAVSLANYVRHAAPRELWAFRVRISGGDAPALTLERSKYCPPVPPPGDLPYARKATITGTVAVEGMPMLAPPPSSEVTIDKSSVIPVEALIAVDGRVLLARALGSSGIPQRDAQIVHDLQRLKFTPAKLDGQPIEAVFRSGQDSPRP